MPGNSCGPPRHSCSESHPGANLPAGDGAEAGTAGPSVAQILRRRCQAAECWDWQSLMRTMLEEREAARHVIPSDGLRDVRTEEERRFSTITKLVQADAVERAKRV